MDKHDRVMEIFLNECREIFEEIEPKLLNLEDYPDDNNLINDIFRAVHTLKGNANSFGFTKLGEFVHHFEDLLSIYRKEENTLQTHSVDLFIRAFDIVTTVFEFEENQRDGYPENYYNILDEIKVALDFKENNQTESFDEVVSASSFVQTDQQNEIVQKMLEFTKFNPDDIGQDTLYELKMSLDRDIYLRGYNHQIFFRLLSEIGTIVYSYYKMYDDVPYLEDFDTQESYIESVYIYLLTQKNEFEISDVFEFIAEEHEISIAKVDFEPKEIKKEIQEHQESIDEPQNTSVAKSAEKVKSSIRVESIKLDELFDSIGELVIAQSYISQNEKIRSINDSELNQYLDMLTKSTRIIQSKVMNLRMVPIKDTFLKMKRVVRDVSMKTGKEIDLILSGEDTEIDKTMVDKLSEPLIHLLRNSVDHGIEENEQAREKAGKEKCGIIHLSAAHKGSSFVIEIRDDGRGIDTKKILKIALEKGLAKKDENYTDDEIVNFLFCAGFSTASSITDVSGRGVGLDAVKRSIEELRGKVSVETSFGEGSIFRIILPLTLAIIDGLSVRVNDEMLIVPTLSVVESFSPVVKSVHHVKGKGEFIDYRGEILPIIRLNRLLNLGESTKELHQATFICIDHERGRYILQVDELLGRQQVVIKSLGVLRNNVKEISGAAILGTGNIALILNTEGIRDYLDVETSHL